MDKYEVELWSHVKLFLTEVKANSIEESENVIEKNVTFGYQIVNVQKK